MHASFKLIKIACFTNDVPYRPNVTGHCGSQKCRSLITLYFLCKLYKKNKLCLVDMVEGKLNRFSSRTFSYFRFDVIVLILRLVC